MNGIANKVPVVRTKSPQTHRLTGLSSQSANEVRTKSSPVFHRVEGHLVRLVRLVRRGMFS